MYKNGSSSSSPSSGSVTIEDFFEGDGDAEATGVDGFVAGEEGSEESLSVEEPMDDTFLWHKVRLDPELSEFDETVWMVRLELEVSRLGMG